MSDREAGRQAAIETPPPVAGGIPPAPVAPVAPDLVPGGRAAGLLSLPMAVAAFWLTYWCVDIVSPGLPVMQERLSLSDTVAGLVFSTFFGGRLVANLPAALLVDRRGARATAAVGGGLLLAGSILAAIAGGPALLLPSRFVQGTGVSLLVAAALLSTVRHQPGGGAAMTTFNITAGLGGASGLVSGGLLAGTIGWRAIFWLSAGLAAAMIAGALFPTRRSGARRAAAREQRPAPVPRPAVSWRVLAGALAANLLVYFNYAIFVVGFPLLADQRFATSTEGIGVLLVVTNLLHLAGALPSGRIVRRWGCDRALGGGLLLAAAGMATALLAPGALWLAAPVALYAIGQVVANTAAGDQVLRLGGQGGRAVGMVRLSSDVGLVVGPAVIGALADLLGVGAPFAVLAALTAVAALALLRPAGSAGTGRA